MALSSASFPVAHAKTGTNGRTLSRASVLASSYAQWRSSRALRAVQRYDGLQARLDGMLRANRHSWQPTLGAVLSAEITAMRTAAELRSHDDRQLDDIEIPRELIGHVAILSSFGWPLQQAREAHDSPNAGLLARARRTFFPTRQELDETYLAGSVDIYDLESRMAEIDRRTERSGHI